MKLTARAVHRDLGYLYVGLIISFAASGVLMNHRQVWHAEKYTIEKRIEYIKPLHDLEFNDDLARSILAELKVNDEFKRQNLKGEEFRLVCKNTDVDIELATGKVEIREHRPTPIIADMMKLHKNTSNWWIYYSDVFGISLIVIAITGTFIMAGSKHSFRNRGWKLSLAGLLFPLLFLLFLQ